MECEKEKFREPRRHASKRRFVVVEATSVAPPQTPAPFAMARCRRRRRLRVCASSRVCAAFNRLE